MIKLKNDVAINARLVRKWTQQKAADRAGFHRSTLASIENGHLPNLATAYCLAEAYGLSVYDIFLPSFVEKCNGNKRSDKNE